MISRRRSRGARSGLRSCSSSYRLFPVFFLTQVLSNSNMLVPLMMLGIALGILWSMWSQIPQWFRKAIYSMLKRKRDGGAHGGNR